ncbi:hypothetical protein A0256_05055 [Mucilaginibacter sp. PAMC 26640]|nr:hypothetical protein A0256_05055 [Mucilaginibacter sp. PAMC 26640]
MLLNYKVMKKIIFALSLIICVFAVNFNAQAQRRISPQAKGAIIGGAGGALLGGILGHNVQGALIGAAIGAGGGYIVGNEHQRAVQKRANIYQNGYAAAYRNSNYRSSGNYETSYRHRYKKARYSRSYYRD